MWKCSRRMPWSSPASRKRCTTEISWAADRPNLDFSPPVSAHLLEASEDSRTRRPICGCTPRAAASSISSATSDSFSMTMNTLWPSFCPISARRMNSRSL
ncbi:hypothetical protein D3C81_2101170 [compost metagenome]